MARFISCYDRFCSYAVPNLCTLRQNKSIFETTQECQQLGLCVFFVTGLPFHTPFSRSQILSTSHFIGCLSDVIINDQPISLLRASVKNVSGITLGCQTSTLTQCHSDSCNYHGVCVEMWAEFKCRCDDGYEGDRWVLDVLQRFSIQRFYQTLKF